MILGGAKQLDQVTYANELSANSRGTQLICIIGFNGSELVMKKQRIIYSLGRPKSGAPIYYYQMSSRTISKLIQWYKIN